MCAQSLKPHTLSRKGHLYAKLAKYSDTVLVRDDRDANLVYVVHGTTRRPPRKALEIPPDHTEVIGWFAGREVVRVR